MKEQRPSSPLPPAHHVHLMTTVEKGGSVSHTMTPGQPSQFHKRRGHRPRVILDAPGPIGINLPRS